MFQPLKLIEEYNKLQRGQARLSGIQYAVNEADMAKDYSYMLYFRYEYADSCGQLEDGLIRYIYLVFPEMLKIFEEHPDVKMPACCYLTAVEAVERIFCHVIDCADYFYQIPLTDVEQYFTKYKSFCLEYGFDLKDYYVASARFFRAVDKERAWQSFEEYKTFIKNNHIKDMYTIDFECEMEIYYDNIETALRIAKPLLEGKYKNSYAAVFECGRFLDYYILEGQDMEKAGYFYNRLVKLRKKFRKRPCFFLDELLYLILTDLNEAWNFYKKEAPHQAVSTISLFEETFAFASVIMMGSLAKNGKKQVHIGFSNKLPYHREDGCYQTKDLAQYFDKMARELAGKFDERNGNQIEMEEYRKYLTAAKL